MLTFNYGSTYFSNKVVLTKFITKTVKRGGMSTIWPNWCCQQSITVLSTPPSSMTYVFTHFVEYSSYGNFDFKTLKRNPLEVV